MTTKKSAPVVPAELQHAAWCPKKRIEHTEHADRDITTTHCVDCGAHQAHNTAGVPLPTPVLTGAFHDARRPIDDGVTLEKAEDLR